MATFFIAFNVIVWNIESQYIVFRRIWADPLSPYEAYRFGHDVVLHKESTYYLVREGALTARVEPDGWGGGLKFKKGHIRRYTSPGGDLAKPTSVKDDIWKIWIIHPDGSREVLKIWISPNDWD